MRSKITIQNIADHLGLSKYAVSRALSGKSGVSPQTRDLIIQTAEHMGYRTASMRTPVPARPATDQALPAGGTVLVLFPNLRHQNDESPYWGPLFEGLSAALQAKSIRVLTLTDVSGDSLDSLLHPKAITGVITIGNISTSALREVQRFHLPLVMVDHVDPHISCDHIFTDNWSAMETLVRGMTERGYTSFQFIGFSSEAQSYRERWLSFRTTVEELGLKQQQIPELLSADLSRFPQLLEEVFRQHELPEVLVCVNDFYAAYTLDALRSLSIEGLEQCVFTGFDQTHAFPALKATVRVDQETLGQRAVDQLLWRIQHPAAQPEKRLIQGQIIFRS